VLTTILGSCRGEDGGDFGGYFVGMLRTHGVLNPSNSTGLNKVVTICDRLKATVNHQLTVKKYLKIVVRKNSAQIAQLLK